MVQAQEKYLVNPRGNASKPYCRAALSSGKAAKEGLYSPQMLNLIENVLDILESEICILGGHPINMQQLRGARDQNL